MLDIISFCSWFKGLESFQRMPEFLQQMSIVFLWNVIDRFLNMP